MFLPGFHVFSANAENLTLVGDAGDFGGLIGGSSPYIVVKVRVFQRGTTTLTMDSLLFHRGTGLAGGANLVEHEHQTLGPASTLQAVSLPTTDATTDDWQARLGFNLLQDQLELDPPELWIPCKANDDFAITRATATAHTGVGFHITWAEFIGN